MVELKIGNLDNLISEINENGTIAQDFKSFFLTIKRRKSESYSGRVNDEFEFVKDLHEYLLIDYATKSLYLVNPLELSKKILKMKIQVHDIDSQNYGHQHFLI